MSGPSKSRFAMYALVTQLTTLARPLPSAALTSAASSACVNPSSAAQFNQSPVRNASLTLVVPNVLEKEENSRLLSVAEVGKGT